MDEYYRAVREFPAWLAHPLMQLPAGQVSVIQELRLRTGCCIVLNCRGRMQPVSSLPTCPEALRGLTLTSLQMDEIFYALCGGSVHTHQTELAQGYLTTRTGCRVGVAGRFSDQPDGGAVVQIVTSLNFRIARSVCIPLPDTLRELLHRHFVGLLIVGEPGSGKTTVLRQVALELAGQEMPVTVIDERQEVFPQQNAPLDCIAGVEKARAVQMALRTLAPRVILLDELGGLDETAALEQGFFSGVDYIATLHASSTEEAFLRPQVQYLCQHKMLHAMVLLKSRREPGQISEVIAV